MIAAQGVGGDASRLPGRLAGCSFLVWAMVFSVLVHAAGIWLIPGRHPVPEGRDAEPRVSVRARLRLPETAPPPHAMSPAVFARSPRADAAHRNTAIRAAAAPPAHPPADTQPAQWAHDERHREILTAHRDAPPVRPITAPGESAAPAATAAPVVADHVHGVEAHAAAAGGKSGPAVDVMAMAATRAHSTPHSDVAYLHNPKPAYPALARRLRLEGTVTLRILVNPEGGAEQSKVILTSGVESLDSAALEAVQQWRFVPAREGRKPIAHWVDVPITFKLADR